MSLKIFDLIANAAQSTLGIVSGNFPLVSAALATALSWSGESFNTLFDLASYARDACEKANNSLDTTVFPFLQEMTEFMTSFSSTYYPKINAYFPLDFFLTGLTVYFGVVILGVIIRTIKSFVPTVA